MNTETDYMAFVPIVIQQSQVGDYFVSTIEVRAFGYFETMVFDSRNESVYEARYADLTTAVDQHDYIVSNLDTVLAD